MGIFNKFKDIAGGKTSQYYQTLKEKLDGYKDQASIDNAKDWMNNNKDKVQNLFENTELRDFIFEPFKDVFKPPQNNNIDTDIYGFITTVAIVNAALAGLPGRMGIGLYIVIALEAWMAFRIARHVGIDIKSISDIWKYLGVFAATVGVILYLFRNLLGLAFSLFSIVPGTNPLILAEIFITDLVGILFLTGFREAKETGSFKIPARMTATAVTSAKDLFKHQFKMVETAISPANIKTVATRLKDYLTGNITDMRTVNGEAFATIAMAYLMAGKTEKLQGPLGETFIQAIKTRWHEQIDQDATTQDIANHFSKYTKPEQMTGAINTIKGKMFEIMITDQHNQNNENNWQATMHTDETFPGSDIILKNSETNQKLEVSLKAVAADNQDIIETALAKHPDIPIITTDEVAELYQQNPMIWGSSISNQELHDITTDNFEQLIKTIEPHNQNQVILGGVTAAATAALWPFTVAYLRNKITAEQLQKACTHILGETGTALASRLAYATILGPIFAWHMLARGVKNLAEQANPSNTTRLEYTTKTTKNK